MKIKKEQIAIGLIEKYYKSLGFDSRTITGDLGNAMLLSYGLFEIGIVLTVCDVEGVDYLKIEEISFDEKYQGQGMGTSILSVICMTCEELNVKVGLWTEDLKLRAWYDKFGFIPVEVNRTTGHFWFKKIATVNNDYISSKIGKKNFEELEHMRMATRENYMYLAKRFKF